MAATRVLPLRAAASSQVAGTVRIEFLADKTRVILALAPTVEPCAAFLAGENPASPVPLRLSPVNGGYEGACQSMGDVYALTVCAADGHIIYEANRTLPANKMEAFRRACRGRGVQGAAPAQAAESARRVQGNPPYVDAVRTNKAASAPSAELVRRVQGNPPYGDAVRANKAASAPSAESAPRVQGNPPYGNNAASDSVCAAIDSLPPPKSEALGCILATAKQLFPSPQPADPPPALPSATKRSEGHAPSRGVRRSRAKKAPAGAQSAAPQRIASQRIAPQRMASQRMASQHSPLSLPFPDEDVFAAGFSHPVLAQGAPLRPSVRAAPTLKGEKTASPLPNTYPAYTFYRVPLPFYRQPHDYCLIGLDGAGGTVYALPVGEGKKKLPPLCAGAALRRGTDGVMYATLKL